MSKIGKQPVTIPSGVSATLKDGEVIVASEKNKIVIPVLKYVKVSIEGEIVSLSISGSSKQARSNWGTMRALVQNAVNGLSKGFEKTLILEGVGFRITKEGENLSLNLGFSHPIKYQTPDGVTFEVDKNSVLKVKGFDKALVGQVAAEIRAMKKPEPYKGKGFRYSDEVIRRKAGKKAATAAAA